MLDAEGGEVHVVLGRGGREARGLAQRVVGLVDAPRRGQGAGGQVVELGRRRKLRGVGRLGKRASTLGSRIGHGQNGDRSHALRDQLLDETDRARVVAGLDAHQGFVEPGGVGILVALARGGEEAGPPPRAPAPGRAPARLRRDPPRPRAGCGRARPRRPSSVPRRGARVRSAASRPGPARSGCRSSRSEGWLRGGASRGNGSPRDRDGRSRPRARGAAPARSARAPP